MASCHLQVSLILSTCINITETTYSCQFYYVLVINRCVTAVKVSNFSGYYLRNRSTLDIGVLGYIGILYHMEHPPEVWHIPPGTPCICVNSFFSRMK
jgi:hypothetical protein